MNPHSQGYALAWDHTGGAIFDQRNQPYQGGSDEAREYYRGYKQACAEIAEHRREIGAVVKESLTVGNTEQLGMGI